MTRGHKSSPWDPAPKASLSLLPNQYFPSVSGVTAGLAARQLDHKGRKGGGEWEGAEEGAEKGKT